MNAPHTIKARWDYHSAVSKCGCCGGSGQVWNGKGMGGNDPDSWDVDCPECEGHGFHTCRVCGFDHVVTGYDCVVCGLVVDLDDSQLTTEVANSLYESVIAAMAARKAQVQP